MKELGKIVEEQDIQIPWSTVSKHMGKRSRLSCFKKWQKLSGLGIAPGTAALAGDDENAAGDSIGDAVGASLMTSPPADGAGEQPTAAAASSGNGKRGGRAATEATSSSSSPPPARASKRTRYSKAPTAGAAAAMAAAQQQQQHGHHHHQDGGGGDEHEQYHDADMFHSAKIAAETVEAVDLPDTEALGV